MARETVSGAQAVKFGQHVAVRQHHAVGVGGGRQTAQRGLHPLRGQGQPADGPPRPGGPLAAQRQQAHLGSQHMPHGLALAQHGLAGGDAEFHDAAAPLGLPEAGHQATGRPDTRRTARRARSRRREQARGRHNISFC